MHLATMNAENERQKRLFGQHRNLPFFLPSDRIKDQSGQAAPLPSLRHRLSCLRFVSSRVRRPPPSSLSNFWLVRDNAPPLPPPPESTLPLVLLPPVLLPSPLSFFRFLVLILSFAPPLVFHPSCDPRVCVRSGRWLSDVRLAPLPPPPSVWGLHGTKARKKDLLQQLQWRSKKN